MSTKEARRVGIMQQVDKKVLTLREASDELGLSVRQIKRVRKLYQQPPNRFTKAYVTILDRPNKPILVEREGKSLRLIGQPP